MTVPQRKITKERVTAGRYRVLASGKHVGYIIKGRDKRWAFIGPSGWHRSSNTLRSTFKGVENYMNCRLPRGLR